VKHVIIGAGAAGISAARTIRKLNGNDEIVIISTDDSVYSRCMLYEYIGGQRDVKGISFIEDGFFEKNNIRWLSNTTVLNVDSKQKLVCFEGGTESYDTLLIAAGAHSIMLPFAKDAKNAFGLCSLPDAQAIRKCAKTAKNIVIVGAGLVGLDAAYGLVKMNKRPTIVDNADKILAQNLDNCASDIYKAKFEEAGCEFKLGCEIDGVITDNMGNIESLTTKCSEKIPCDMLIVAVGTRPSAGFLADSGINVYDGITVNKQLKTNIDGIYAAGDVIGLSGIWPVAVEHGEVAAKNMCGIPTDSENIFAAKNTVNYFGIPSISLGKVTPAVCDITKIRQTQDSYEKVILSDGIVIGVILQGNISHSGFWQFLIKNQVNVSEINKDIFDISFADFYSVLEDGEYAWDIVTGL